MNRIDYVWIYKVYTIYTRNTSLISSICHDFTSGEEKKIKKVRKRTLENVYIFHLSKKQLFITLRIMPHTTLPTISKKDVIALELELRKLLNHHHKMKKYFFWTAPTDIAERMAYEKINSIFMHFTYEKRDVDLKCMTFCSWNRIFYTTKFYINEKKITIREVRKLWWEIRNTLWYENFYYRDGALIQITEESPLSYY